MINKIDSRVGRIGGSDAHLLYSNTDTKSFINWWWSLLGITEQRHFENIYMAAGTILEEFALDVLEIPIESRSLNFNLPGTIAAISTDAYHEGILHEVKTMSRSSWKDKVLPRYMHQITHGVAVIGCKEARIHFMLLDDYNNIFNNKFELITKIYYPETEKHLERIKYFTDCYNSGKWPE